MTPHPQRCETCKNKKKIGSNWWCNILDDCVYGTHMVSSTQKTINVVGCASHSTAASGREQLERFAISMSNTIGALESLEPDKYSENWFEIQILKKWLRELRKQDVK